jgi:hypothetical protein
VVKIEATRIASKNQVPQGKLTDSKPKKPHLFLTRILMVLLGLMFFLTISAKQTVFNSEYIQQQVEKSDAADTINQQLNTQLQQSGVPQLQTNLIPNDLINDELKTMIGQFYNDQTVELDQNLITNEINQSVGTSGIIQQNLVSMVVTQVVKVLDGQLDTQKLSQYAGQVAKLQKLNQIVMMVSGVGFVLVALFAFIKKRGLNLLGSTLTVIGSFAAIISAIAYLSNILSNLPIQYAVIKTIVEQVGQDILIREFTIALGVLVLGIILLVGSAITQGLTHRKNA